MGFTSRGGIWMQNTSNEEPENCRQRGGKTQLTFIRGIHSTATFVEHSHKREAIF
jgi:hypothetical protein